MKELLAKQLLAEVLGLDDLDEIETIASRLTTLSEVKYDDYGGYSPGVKFIESLAVWLYGFDETDRSTALNFVMERLTYVSEGELDHLISTVYKDLLRPLLIAKTATMIGQPSWAVRRITDSNEFKSLQRRTLILGMSDGARLDKLRRYSTLSTEQFHLVSVLDRAKQLSVKKKLRDALQALELDGPDTFNSVIVVDDFSGSGTTMLRSEVGSDGEVVWDGKLSKLREHLADLKKARVVADDASVIVLLYLISDTADRELKKRIEEAGYGAEFELHSAHKFSKDFPLSPTADSAFWLLCEKYFRGGWINTHTKIAGDFRHGYGKSALPLVLHHNAPNNAPPIVWKDESDDDRIPGPMKDWMGVFPRYERHHPGRP